MSGIHRSNSTYARVSFFTYAGALQHAIFPGRVDTFDPLALPALGQEVATTLVGFTHDKRFGGGASGSATIQLKPRHRRGAPWVDILQNGDWWMIDVIKNGVSQGLSFGKIDEVRLDVNANQGEGDATVTVVGRDVGFALDDTPVYFNPLDPNIDRALGLNLRNTVESLTGRADKIVVGMIEAMMGRDPVNVLLGGHIDVPPGIRPTFSPKRWIDFVDLKTCVDNDLRGEVNASGAITPDGGNSVWQYVDTWRNPVLNELFIDTVPLPGTPKKACLVLREKPFVDADLGLFSPWFKLMNWNVDVSTVLTASLSRGANRMNHMQVLGDLHSDGIQDSEVFYAPKMNPADVQRHGLKRLQEKSRYWDGYSASAAGTEYQKWLKTVASWNVLNHKYWQGQISLGEMRAEIRIGQKIALTGGFTSGVELAPGLPGVGAVPTGTASQPEPRALTFYVEGVRHTYRSGASPTARTSIMVSRGYIEGLRIPDVAAGVARMTSPVPFLPNPFRKAVKAPNVVTTLEAIRISQNYLGGARGPQDREV